MELARIPRVPDQLQAELPERGPASCLGVVLERSRLLCLQRYEKELFTETAYLEAYRRCQERLNREQLAVFAGPSRFMTGLRLSECYWVLEKNSWCD